MAIPVSGAVPVFSRLVAWAELARPSGCAAKETEGAENTTAGATPVPVSETEMFPCGD
jgi:hypothetical protein